MREKPFHFVRVSIATLMFDNADREHLQTLTPVFVSLVVARMEGRLRDNLADRTAPKDTVRGLSYQLPSRQM